MQIEYDEYMQRYYIPLPGGWEVQTKGKGSSFRLANDKGERVIVPEFGPLHRMLEQMAREVYTATQPKPIPPREASRCGLTECQGKQECERCYKYRIEDEQ